ASHTFQSKYNNLPGDVANAGNFGFTAATTNTYVTAGNGLIEASLASGASGTSKAEAGMESTLFWEHLSVARLIDTALTTAGSGVAANLTASDMPNYFPSASLGQQNYWTVYSTTGLNYYQITGISSTTASSIYQTTNKMTPQQAFMIDSKLDDGRPQ